ncbi:hypothetical protein BJ166DRAFT_513418 [Pestalotiopsis sp. NC0098]|nr:hypothetical protein BJ166DRAFT_513418 [Pestalotiopsis sp. NC0098]
MSGGSHRPVTKGMIPSMLFLFLFLPRGFQLNRAYHFYSNYHSSCITLFIFWSDFQVRLIDSQISTLQLPNCRFKDIITVCFQCQYFDTRNAMAIIVLRSCKSSQESELNRMYLQLRAV